MKKLRQSLPRQEFQALTVHVFEGFVVQWV
jgi:hypothetical protein